MVHPIEDFHDPKQEWRRLFSELLGTFFLVLVAAGGGMMGQAFPDTISRTAAVTAPGLMVMAIILFMGKVSGAHLNPAVSLAFAARGDFPWQRVPGYIVVQLAGATLAALFLHAVIDVSATYGSNYPAAGYSSMAAFWMEFILTLGVGERDPGHGLGCAEHRHRRRVRGRWVHRVGGSVGESDLGHVDEPGPHVRSRPRRGATGPPTGCTSPDRSPAQPSRSSAGSCCAARAVAGPGPAAAQGALDTEVGLPDKE